MKEIDKVKELPKFAVKFANTVFILGILISVLIAIYAIYKIYHHPAYTTNTFYYICFLLGAIFAILFFLGFKLNNNLKINLSLVFVVFSVSVYAFETYLEFSKISSISDAEIRKAIAEKMDVPYDTRTTFEVLNDLIDSGVEAYPSVVPQQLLLSKGLQTKKGRIYPLGGISNITTTSGNESGYYGILEMDEHGFNNPKGLYKKNEVDIVLTGDSFTEGQSVHSDENIGSFLRETGYKTLNFGKGGNGPLIQLATLKEYAEPLQPKVVLWLYYENDFFDLKTEIHISSFLRQYLNENNFSQNLIARQEEIDRVLINFAQENWEKEDEGRKKKEVKKKRITKGWALRILKVFNLRLRMDLYPFQEYSVPLEFRTILEKSNKMVSGWNGKLYFIYLPSYYHYSFITFTRNLSSYKGLDLELYEEVLRTASELNIPIIDIHKEAFEPHFDPLSLFPFRKYAHYNAEGYRLVAETISKRLKEDGIIPSELGD